MKFRISCFICLIFVTVLSSSLQADDRSEIDFFIYGGKYSETDLLPIVFKQETEYKDSYIGVIGGSIPFDTNLRFAEFEAEVNLVKHFGIMNHFELNGLYIARISNLFYLPISFAFGEGLSIASQNPLLENKDKGIYIYGRRFDYATGLLILNNLGFYPLGTQIQTDRIYSRNVLNYVMMELDFGLNNVQYDPRIFIRIHHRSGVFGLYCSSDPACGSNFVTYGVKFSI